MCLDAYILFVQVLRIDKTGPLTAVSPGQAFTFTIRVDFDQVGPFTAVRIVDDLPAGLLTSLTAATWTATKSGSQLTGSKHAADTDVVLALGWLCKH